VCVTVATVDQSQPLDRLSDRSLKGRVAPHSVDPDAAPRDRTRMRPTSGSGLSAAAFIYSERVDGFTFDFWQNTTDTGNLFNVDFVSFFSSFRNENNGEISPLLR